MDLITKAIDEIKFTIPRPILNLAYVGQKSFRAAPVSLEEQIRRKTINARVLVDANIVGGETIVVDLGGLTPIQHDEYNYVYDIPGERVNYRTILTALSVIYMAYNTVQNSYIPGMGMVAPNIVNDVSSAADRVMASHSNIPITSNAEVRVVGHNSVMIRNHIITATATKLRCVVCHDEQLSNISIRNAHDFAKLCQLAVKSFIYNELLIALDRGYLEHGQELPSVKSYVDGLADAEEMYQTFLKEKWRAVSFINNRVAHEDFLRMQINY